MCWNAFVSFSFASFDCLVVFVLILRNVDRDRLFALLMAPIAFQEIFQFLFWWTDAISSCTFLNRILSLCIVVTTSTIPFICIYIGHHTTDKWIRSSAEKRQPGKLERLLQHSPTYLYGVATLYVIFLCYVLPVTQTWCTTVGPHGHQQWICGVGAYKLYGYISYVAFLAMYVAPMAIGLRQLKPTWERDTVGLLGAFPAAIVYSFFSQTLEACSIWCWSAFIEGAFLLVRPYLHTIFL